MLILGVIIEYAATSLDRPFSYAYKGNKIIKEGIRVYVEFAHRKVVGYVVSVAPSSLNLEEYQKETGIKVKEIESIIDEEPLFNEELSLLSKKIASYYFAPLISVYQSMLPPSLKPKSSSLSKPKIAYESFYVPLSSCEEGLSAKQKELLRLINKEKEIAKTNKKREKTGLPPINNDHDIYQEASIEYKTDSNGGYYLIRYERGDVKAWGAIKG